MLGDVLKFMSQQMDKLGLRYEYGIYTGKVLYPYFIGEYIESPVEVENGQQDGTFILTGFTRDDITGLIRADGAIAELFDNIDGYAEKLSAGDVIAGFHYGAHLMPSDDVQLHKIEINIDIKTWKARN